MLWCYFFWQTRPFTPPTPRKSQMKYNLSFIIHRPQKLYCAFHVSYLQNEAPAFYNQLWFFSSDEQLEEFGYVPVGFMKNFLIKETKCCHRSGWRKTHNASESRRNHSRQYYMLINRAGFWCFVVLETNIFEAEPFFTVTWKSPV